jgi:hypothetical protein
MILEDDSPVHVHNPKKIKWKHGGIIVSEPETREYKAVLRKAGLWPTLVPSLMGIFNLFLFLVFLSR